MSNIKEQPKKKNKPILNCQHFFLLKSFATLPGAGDSPTSVGVSSGPATASEFSSGSDMTFSKSQSITLMVSKIADLSQLFP